MVTIGTVSVGCHEVKYGKGRPLPVETRGQQVARRLLSDIQTGAFKVGEKLPAERELMERYGAGRNTLREAIRGAVALGLLDVRAGSGTTVREFDTSDAIARSMPGTLTPGQATDELLEFRLLVETEAAALAATRANQVDIDAIRLTLAEYQDAVRRREDVYSRDVAFHRAIAAAAHNTIFLGALDTSAKLLESAMRASDRAPGDVTEAAAEHALIAHHVLLSDSAAAERAMREHLLAGSERRNRAGLLGDN
jgi:GntR family transcriptional repressor for pyruvate dehydrogenase complex